MAMVLKAAIKVRPINQALQRIFNVYLHKACRRNYNMLITKKTKNTGTGLSDLII
jgi:hypothetical protein